MNPFTVFGYRIFQKTMHIAAYFMPYREPKLLTGHGSRYEVGRLLAEKKFTCAMVVVDPFLKGSPLLSGLLSRFADEGINYILFDHIVPNPPFGVIEEGYAAYRDGKCDCLLAIGGGSCIDTAKAIGVKSLRPQKELSTYKAILSVRKKIPFLIAIPTTAGTGSEATLSSVVVDERSGDKFAINDPALIPDVAVLDEELLLGMPPKLIASTGMDALTHAVESYIGRSSTRKTARYALEAITLIHDHLPAFYKDPSSDKDAAAMQKASYMAGVSFARAYVGYVHAIAHAYGGYLGVAHGYANAVILPYVLEAYGPKAYRKLAKISRLLGLAKEDTPKKEAAEAFIAYLKSLKRELAIPERFGGIVKEEGLYEKIAHHADEEANPLYPVPRILTESELLALSKLVDRP